MLGCCWAHSSPADCLACPCPSVKRRFNEGRKVCKLRIKPTHMTPSSSSFQNARFTTPIQVTGGFSAGEGARLGHKVTFSSCFGEKHVVSAVSWRCFALHRACLRQNSDSLVCRIAIVLATATKHLKKALESIINPVPHCSHETGKLNHLPKISLGISAWSGMGCMNLIEFSLIGAGLIAIAYRKIKVCSHSQISATRITPLFTTQDSNYLCCQ